MSFSEVIIFGADVLPDLVIVRIVVKLPDILDEGGSWDEVVFWNDGDVAGYLCGRDRIRLGFKDHGGCVSKTNIFKVNLIFN